MRWRRKSGYASDDDYAFASETMRGKQPYWPDNPIKRHIRPVAKANGINKNIGWHTFRHSFGTLLKANGENVKTVQDALQQVRSLIRKALPRDEEVISYQIPAYKLAGGVVVCFSGWKARYKSFGYFRALALAYRRMVWCNSPAKDR